MFESGLLDSSESFSTNVDLKGVNVESTPFLVDYKGELDLSKPDDGETIFLDTIDVTIPFHGNNREDSWESLFDDTDLPLIPEENNHHQRNECNNHDTEADLYGNQNAGSLRGGENSDKENDSEYVPPTPDKDDEDDDDDEDYVPPTPDNDEKHYGADEEYVVPPTPNNEDLENDENDGDNEEEEVNQRKRTRKRKRQTQLWKKNIIKSKRNKGEEYTDDKGVVRPAKKMGEPCDESCKKKCFEKVNEEERRAFFQEYWSCPDQHSKWEFIAREVKRIPKKTGQDNETSKRNFSREYLLRINKMKTVKVCKVMFLSTLGISDSAVTTAFNKLGDGAHISPDKRGAQTSGGRKQNPLLSQRVKEHIDSFPRQPSHYIREASNREYLVEEVQTVAELHEAFKEWMQTEHPSDPVASYRQYLDIFNYEYNISFFVSKKDMCDQCVEYENAIGDEKANLEGPYKEHKKNADLAQKMRLADRDRARLKENKNLCVANFDYEKTLISPKCKASCFYYRRKLGVYNFTIVDVGKKEDFCYVYHECIGGKGSNEVSSFLMHFTEIKVNEGYTIFVFCCDNCGGQNKNRGVTSTLAVAAAKFNITITLRFLEKGHTWNSADTVHSAIEIKTKPHNIYSPREWFDRIAKAKRKVKPMKIIEVTQEMIKDWKSLIPMLQLEKNVDRQKIPWQAIREFKFGSGDDNHSFCYRVLLHDEAPSFTVSTKNVGRPVNLAAFEPQRAYENLLPISQAKYADLKYYCDHQLIPQQWHEFYLSLPHGDTPAGRGVLEEQADDPDPDPVPGRARKRRSVQPKATRNKKKRPQAAESHGSSEDDALEP